MHGEFMLVDGGKMSKSLGNTYTLSQLAERGYSPMHFRYFCSNAHYRSKLNFTFSGMDSAKVSYERLLSILQAHRTGTFTVTDDVLKDLDDAFGAAVADDLNIPKAMGLLWTLAKLPDKSAAVYELAQKWDKVLGLSLDALPAMQDQDLLESEVAALIQARTDARAAKDFAKADEIRKTLLDQGIVLEDTKDGVKWKKN
jgi:cysteinyl-tRNA synthetase